ncbi:Hpt domain-containing protein [Microlunatus parietis]|uniref:HPt (Histidine-containing phosphotransfer) domain-containing protein n=1 Tax=Microlunatus parietis TaxID=682979 RepID=A0A7Y9L8C3_9ACTN|nr:Hpt domain-containing protein [Microlunatus parietis]NYE70619.1 HPt (histidine-containing phosphotransfer) domain-containing protein [Microlunatus parietis]
MGAMTDSDRPSPSPEAVFDSISAQAQETNRIRVEALAEVILRSDPTGLSEDDRRQAKDLAHQIAGSAGTFGFDLASEVARQVEQLLLREPDSAQLAELEQQVVELRSALA